MQQEALLCFCLMDFLPLRNCMLARTVGAAAARCAILQNPGRMLEEMFVLLTFGARIEADLGLIDGPIHLEALTTVGWH
jgi:hypothetical protein